MGTRQVLDNIKIKKKIFCQIRSKGAKSAPENSRHVSAIHPSIADNINRDRYYKTSEESSPGADPIKNLSVNLHNAYFIAFLFVEIL